MTTLGIVVAASRSLQTVIKAVGILLVSTKIITASATTIELVNQDSPGEGFNDSGAPFANQTSNPGNTLGAQRLAVFRAAADFWEARLVSDVPIRISANMDPLFCGTNSATLGSAGPRGIFMNFANAPRSNTWYVQAVANSLAGRDLDPNNNDISARFNVAIDNNDNCLRGTNWWLGINSPAPRGTISLFETVLHEIGHGLGVVSFANTSNGQLVNNTIDAYSRELFDVQRNQFWRDMTNAQRAASAINTGNLVWRGVNADNNSSHLSAGSRTSGYIRMYAPNPLRQGSSVSHWDTALTPNELMEPFATSEADFRSTLQLLKDVGWRLASDLPPPPPQPGQIGFTAASYDVIEDSGPARIVLERSGGNDGAVSVQLNSSNISATGGGVDYISIINRTVNWADGESGTQTIDVTVINDGRSEPGGETARFAISNATGGANINRATATLTIQDPAPTRLQFVDAPYTVREDNGPLTIRVRRSGNTNGAVSVRVNSIDDTATGGGVDYDRVINRTVSWASGQTGIRSFTIDINNDGISEPGGERFDLVLGNTTGNPVISTPTTSVTISDPNEPQADDQDDLLLSIIPAISAAARARNAANLKTQTPNPKE